MSYILRTLAALIAVLLLPIAAHAQQYDFSVSFSGLDNIGGDGTVSGLMTFANGNLTTLDDLAFVTGGQNRDVLSVSSSTGALGGGLAGTTLSALDLIFQVNYNGTNANVRVVYPDFDTTTFTANSLGVTGAVAGSGESRTTWRTEYTFGGATVNSTTGEPNQEPVAVPEINGGGLALLAFILGTLCVYIVGRARNALTCNAAFA